MISIIMFLAGFYLGILVFSLLIVASRKDDNVPLIKLPTPYSLHRTN
jgi:hypothetical protein